MENMASLTPGTQTMAHCPGTPTYTESGGRMIKDCSSCTFPHRAENYDAVIACLQNA